MCVENREREKEKDVRGEGLCPVYGMRAYPVRNRKNEYFIERTFECKAMLGCFRCLLLLPQPQPLPLPSSTKGRK